MLKIPPAVLECFDEIHIDKVADTKLGALLGLVAFGEKREEHRSKLTKMMKEIPNTCARKAAYKHLDRLFKLKESGDDKKKAREDYKDLIEKISLGQFDNLDKAVEKAFQLVERAGDLEVYGPEVIYNTEIKVALCQARENLSKVSSSDPEAAGKLEQISGFLKSEQGARLISHYRNKELPSSEIPASKVEQKNKLLGRALALLNVILLAGSVWALNNIEPGVLSRKLTQAINTVIDYADDGPSLLEGIVDAKLPEDDEDYFKKRKAAVEKCVNDLVEARLNGKKTDKDIERLTAKLTEICTRNEHTAQAHQH